MAIPSPQGPPSRTLLHKGRKFDFELIEFVGGDGNPVRREVVRHPGAVVILPVLDDGRLVLIRNIRASVDKALFELPAGTLEPPEPPEACAARELIEETGYRAATLTPLGRFYTSPGMSDELMRAFIATGLTHVGQHLETDERITVVEMPSAAVLGMIDAGELVDAKSMLTLLWAMRRGLINV
jgi:ADP-ribose pyrophosphatase